MPGCTVRTWLLTRAAAIPRWLVDERAFTHVLEMFYGYICLFGVLVLQPLRHWGGKTFYFFSAYKAEG